jgi:hypothetical protein
LKLVLACLATSHAPDAPLFQHIVLSVLTLKIESLIFKPIPASVEKNSLKILKETASGQKKQSSNQPKHLSSLPRSEPWQLSFPFYS